jgi:phosphate-selective porin OprO/OprP
LQYAMKNLTSPGQKMRAILVSFVFFSIISFQGSAQDKPAINVFTRKQKGVGFVTSDSVFSLNFQFRMQNRAMYISKSDTDFAPEAFEFRVRRLRMKFTGFVYNPKLTYYIQLGFSRGDMDWRGPENNQINNSPNIIRDAIIYYKPTPRLQLGFGQTKIPGNRQRVVSSGDQQFFDRSIVNSRFTLDRDFGFFGHYTTVKQRTRLHRAC